MYVCTVNCIKYTFDSVCFCIQNIYINITLNLLSLPNCIWFACERTENNSTVECARPANTLYI